MAWALIVDGSVDTVYNNARDVTIDNILHSKEIFKSWSDSDRAAIGIYPVTAGTKKDDDYYDNGNPSYSWNSGTKKVTESYSPSARTLSTVKAEQTNILNNVASNLIKPYTWLAERKTFANTDIPDAVTSYVGNVRTACSTATTNVANASDVDAVATAVGNVSWPDNSSASSYARDTRGG